MATTEICRLIRAPRSQVYRALLDAEAVRRWMVPEGMTSELHTFAPRQGGTFRISLTYDLPTSAGKTSSQTDSFHGRFAELVSDERVVQVVEFESDDPALSGAMTITYTLSDATEGTCLTGLHEDLPPGVDPPRMNWAGACRSASSRNLSKPADRLSGPPPTRSGAETAPRLSPGTEPSLPSWLYSPIG